MNSTILYILTSILCGNCISGLLSVPSFCYLIPIGFVLKQYGLNNLEIAGDLGVLLLFFTIGLELSWHEIVILSPFFIKIICLNFALVTALAFGISWFVSVKSAVILAMIFTLSSTPLMLGFLKDNQQSHSNLGYQSLALILFQDLLSMLLIMYFDNYKIGFNWFVLIRFLGNIVIFMVVWFIAKHLIKYIAQFLNNKDHSMKLSGYLGMLLLLAILSSKLGLSKEFGVMSLGIALASVNDELQIEEYVSMLKTILISCFFMSIGGLISWSFIQNNYQTILVALGFVCTIKSLVILPFATNNHIVKMLLFSNLSDVSFILLKPAYELGLVSEFYYNLSISVVVLSLIIFPIVLKLGAQLLQYDNKEHYNIVIFGHSNIATGLANNFTKNGLSNVLMTPKLQDNIKLTQMGLKVAIGHFAYQQTLNTLFYIYKPQAVVITNSDHQLQSLINFLIKCWAHNIKVFILTNDPIVTTECKKHHGIVIGINYDNLISQSLDTILQNINNMFLHR